MIYPMKVKDKDGNLKYEVSQRDCLVSFWKSLGDGLYNEFTGAEIQPEQRGNKLKRVTCVREGCSIEFQKHNAMHKYCSAKCTRDASNARHSAKMVADRKPTYCRKCNKEFQPERQQRYCYNPCEAQHYSKVKPKKKKCATCKKQFKTANPTKRNCSQVCAKAYELERQRVRRLRKK